MDIHAIFSLTIEAFYVFTFTGALSAKKRKPLHHLLIFSILFGFLAFFVGNNIPSGFNTLFSMFLYILMNCILYGDDLIFSTLCFCISFFSLLIIEIIVFSFFYFMGGYLPNDITSNEPLLFKVKLVVYFIQLSLTFLFYNKSNLFNIRKKIFLNEKTNKILIYIFSIILLFAIQFIMLIQYFNDSDVTVIAFFILNFICLGFVAYKLHQYLFHLAKKEILLEEQNVYLEQIEDLVKHLKTQKHEFGNHLNMLYSLVQSDKETSLEHIKKYIEDLDMDLKISSNVIQINEPLISSILCTKMAIAEQKHIKMDIEITDTFTCTTLSLPEITVILNNLLGNAIEFCETIEIDYRYICLFIYGNEEQVHISISNENGGKALSEDMKKKIFEQGFSTKSNTIGSRGFGLHNVKQVIDKHNGTIQILSDLEQTCFNISLPKSNNQTKILFQSPIKF